MFFSPQPRQASELGRIGGRKNRYTAQNVEPLPTLDTAIAVRNVANRFISEMYLGTVDPKMASGLERLLNSQLRAIETADLESSVAELQRPLAEVVSRQNHGSIVAPER